MTSLYTLAFPLLEHQDAAWIDAFREAHDPQHAIVATHFTLVFGSDKVSEKTYLEHVEAVSASAYPIDFTCRYAMLSTEPGSARGLMFLVPDEGFSGLSLLHDRLYEGPLSANLRLDLPFVPHITIGASGDRADARRRCDELNSRPFCVQGRVAELVVVANEGGMLRTIGTYPLAG